MQPGFQIPVTKSAWASVWIIVHNCLTAFPELDNLLVRHFQGFVLLNRSQQIEADVRLLLFDRGIDQKIEKEQKNDVDLWRNR